MADAETKEKTEFVFPDEKEIKDGETQIEVVNDTPVEDRKFIPGTSKDVGDVTETELEAYSANVQKRIKELSFARHDERRVREQVQREKTELENLARNVIDENKRLKQYVHTGEQVYAGTAKAAAQAKLEIAKATLKAAHEAFDSDAIVAAQQDLTLAQMDLIRAENFKITPLQNESTAVYSQPTEQGQPDEQAQSWQQRNRWYGVDEEMTNLALVTHKQLVANGVDPRSDEYYKAIDANVRKRYPENFGEASTSANKPHRTPATVVAPTARSSSAKKIILTQTQVAIAKKFGIPLEEYARHQSLLETGNGR